jgi:hypothetical protein
MLSRLLDLNCTAGLSADCVPYVWVGVSVEKFGGSSHRRDRVWEGHSGIKRYTDIAATAVEPVTILAAVSTLRGDCVVALYVTLEGFSACRNIAYSHQVDFWRSPGICAGMKGSLTSNDIELGREGAI